MANGDLFNYLESAYSICQFLNEMNKMGVLHREDSGGFQSTFILFILFYFIVFFLKKNCFTICD